MSHTKIVWQSFVRESTISENGIRQRESDLQKNTPTGLGRGANRCFSFNVFVEAT